MSNKESWQEFSLSSVPVYNHNTFAPFFKKDIYFYIYYAYHVMTEVLSCTYELNRDHYIRKRKAEISLRHDQYTMFDGVVFHEYI